jgi:PAS fold
LTPSGGGQQVSIALISPGAVQRQHGSRDHTLVLVDEDRHDRYPSLWSSRAAGRSRCARNEVWEIRFMSDHIERILGYPASHFIGNAVRSYGSIIHLEDRPYMIDGIDAALATNRRLTMSRNTALPNSSTSRWRD